MWAGFILVLIRVGGGLFWTWRVLWFQKMQGTSWAAEDVLVSQERFILGVDYSVIWCCVWGWIKRLYKFCYLRCQTCRNFSSSVHVNVIWGIRAAGAQLWQSNTMTHLENLSHFEVWGVTCLLGTKSVHSCCLLTVCGNAWQWCDVRQHVAKWCHT